MTTPSRSRRPYKTRDLAMAAYLARIQGYKYELERAGETGRGWPLGAWVFEDSDILRGHIQIFEDRLASVEPYKFSEALKETKGELLDFLGVGDAT